MRGENVSKNYDLCGLMNQRVEYLNQWDGEIFYLLIRWSSQRIIFL